MARMNHQRTNTTKRIKREQMEPEKYDRVEHHTRLIHMFMYKGGQGEKAEEVSRLVDEIKKAANVRTEVIVNHVEEHYFNAAYPNFKAPEGETGPASAFVLSCVLNKLKQIRNKVIGPIRKKDYIDEELT